MSKYNRETGTSLPKHKLTDNIQKLQNKQRVCGDYVLMLREKQVLIYPIPAADDSDITCENGLVNWDDDTPKCECWPNFYGDRCEIRKLLYNSFYIYLTYF